MVTVSAAQRRARLARRHRLAPGHRAGRVEDAADSVVALHATDHTTVYLSAWARVEDMSREDVDRALYVDRSIVKQMAMRRTIFAVPRPTLPAVVAGAAGRVAEAQARQLVRDVERAGLHTDGTAWLAASREPPASIRIVRSLDVGQLDRGHAVRAVCDRAHSSAVSATVCQPGAEGRRCGPSNSMTSVTGPSAL